MGGGSGSYVKMGGGDQWWVRRWEISVGKQGSGGNTRRRTRKAWGKEKGEGVLVGIRRAYQLHSGY